MFLRLPEEYSMVQTMFGCPAECAGGEGRGGLLPGYVQRQRRQRLEHPRQTHVRRDSRWVLLMLEIARRFSDKRKYEGFLDYVNPSQRNGFRPSFNCNGLQIQQTSIFVVDQSVLTSRSPRFEKDD
jgi:hypothetical protein